MSREFVMVDLYGVFIRLSPLCEHSAEHVVTGNVAKMDIGRYWEIFDSCLRSVEIRWQMLVSPQFTPFHTLADLRGAIGAMGPLRIPSA